MAGIHALSLLPWESQISGLAKICGSVVPEDVRKGINRTAEAAFNPPRG